MFGYGHRLKLVAKHGKITSIPLVCFFKESIEGTDMANVFFGLPLARSNDIASVSDVIGQDCKANWMSSSCDRNQAPTTFLARIAAHPSLTTLHRMDK